MTVILALIASAHAEPDVSQQPLKADVDLPVGGVAAIAVPLAMRHPNEQPGDYILVGPSGEVPFVWLVGGSDRRSAQSTVTPTGATNTWIVTPDEAVDGLTITVPYSSTAQVTVRDSADHVVGQGLVWYHDAGVSGNVDLPARATGPFYVAIAWVGDAPYGDPQIEAWIEPVRLPPIAVDPEIGAPFADEAGTVWRDLQLPNPLPVQRVVLDVADAAFDRQIDVVDGGDPAGTRSGGGRVFRSDRDAIVDVAANTTGWDLLVGVEAARGPTLDVKGIHVEVADARILVRDAGPGPFVLYGGRSSYHTNAGWDLEAARDAMLRATASTAVPAAVAPNPAFVPPEVSGNLVDPGAEAILPLYHWRRPLEGSGLVAIALPAEVLAHSKDDHSDLRVVDANGMEIPRTLLRRPGAQVWDTLQPVRTEVGTKSMLAFTLPQADVPVSAVRISSDAPLFSRPVTVARPGAMGPEILRASTWTHDGSPGSLLITLDQRVGDKLIVEIENDRDAPIPVTELAVAWPAWELTTQVPAGGAWLVYGDSRATPPDYDLSMLADELPLRRPAAATLGEPVPIEPEPLSWWDSGLLILGLGVASLGLLAITVRIALATPPGPAAPAVPTPPVGRPEDAPADAPAP